VSRPLFFRRLPAGFCALLLVCALLPRQAGASHTSDYPACRDALDWQGWKEQRLWRATLFGVKRAREAEASEVRFSKDRSIWIKSHISAGGTSAVDEWRSLSPGYESVTWYNSLIDSQTDITPRRGIFDTRQRMSSELVPYITQSYRSLECRLEAICELLALSEPHKEHSPQTVTVKVFGCGDMPAKTLPECHLESNPTQLTTQGDIHQYCQTMIATIRKRETQIAKLVMEYDAGYRSILQLSGIMRGFLGEMRGTVLGSLRGATDLITTFSRVPCFIGSCDDAPATMMTSP